MTLSQILTLFFHAMTHTQQSQTRWIDTEERSGQHTLEIVDVWTKPDRNLGERHELRYHRVRCGRVRVYVRCGVCVCACVCVCKLVQILIIKVVLKVVEEVCVCLLDRRLMIVEGVLDVHLHHVCRRHRGQPGQRDRLGARGARRRVHVGVRC